MELIRSSDGTLIAVERSGAGPPLLLVHGATVSRTCWTPLLPVLQRFVTVCAMDRRGRGASGDAVRYAPEREVEDVLAALDHIGAPAHLLGHGSGAILALEAARRAGPRLRRLVLYEPAIYGSSARLPAGLADRLSALLTSGEREAALWMYLREGLGLTALDMEQMRDRPGWSERVALAHTTPYDARIIGEYVLYPRRMAVVRHPTLLLRGGASPARVRSAVEALAVALPRGQIEVLRGQRHGALEMAAALAPAIVRFLTAPE